MADATRALLRPSDPKVSGCEDCRVLPHRLTTRAEAERRAGRHADLMAHATYVENPQEHEIVPVLEQDSS